MAMIHAWLFSGYTGTHEDGMQALSRLDHKKYQEVM
jgi:ribose 5-phosphate isomerase B